MCACGCPAPRFSSSHAALTPHDVHVPAAHLCSPCARPAALNGWACARPGWMETSHPRLCAPPFQACFLWLLWCLVLRRFTYAQPGQGRRPGPQNPCAVRCVVTAAHRFNLVNRICCSPFLMPCIGMHLHGIFIASSCYSHAAPPACRYSISRMQHARHYPECPPDPLAFVGNKTTQQQDSTRAYMQPANTCHLGSQHPARPIEE